jgi:hypothetical protein
VEPEEIGAPLGHVGVARVEGDVVLDVVADQRSRRGQARARDGLDRGTLRP